MQLKWVDAGHTMIAETEGNHTTLVEHGNPRWDEVSGRDDIAPFVPPPEPTPEEILTAERAAMICSPAQMRLTLLAAGQLATVQAIADGDPAASILWEYAAQISRTSPLIDALGGPQGFTPEQIDDLFRAAMAVDI